ncbi:MAG: HAMP domain-containing protein, partial [Cellulomonadaceae bacterium]|nr:HAMP domain-containing protein [Cellulomonadaceae bacterium]
MPTARHDPAPSTPLATSPGRAHRPRPAGIRARSTGVAVGVVTLALLVTAVALVATLQRSVRSEALTAATTRAQDVASQLVADGGLTEHLGLEPAPGEAVVIQLLLDGVVVGASPAMEGRPPLTALAPAPGQTLTTSVALPSGDGDDDGSVAAVLGVDLPDVDTVVVALSLETGEGTVGRLVALLALVCPLLVAVVGVVTYVLTGRALAPVEDIRRRTASISAADLSVRVPVPDTGDEVASLAVTMNEMLDRLDDAHHAQRRFVSDASHELRSPLATLRTEIEVALRDPGDWERTARGLLAESVRMQTLVDDLLTLAKADERGVPVRRVEVDLDDLADAEVRRLRTSGRTVAAHVEPVRVMGDRDQLARVLRNLTENADRHAVARVAVRV